MTSDDIATYNDEQKAVLDYALEVFEKGKVDSFVSRKNFIDVKYHVGDKDHSFTYSVQKGVLLNDR